MHAGAASAALGELERLRAATLDLAMPAPNPTLILPNGHDAALASAAAEVAALREKLAAAEAAGRSAVLAPEAAGAKGWGGRRSGDGAHAPEAAQQEVVLLRRRLAQAQSQACFGPL